MLWQKLLTNMIYADTPGNEWATPNMVNILNFYQSNARMKLTNEIRSLLSGVIWRFNFEARHVFVEGCILREKTIASAFIFKSKEDLKIIREDGKFINISNDSWSMWGIKEGKVKWCDFA